MFASFQLAEPEKEKNNYMKTAKAKTKATATEEFDRRFDKGEDVTEMADYTIVDPPESSQRVNVDFPPAMVARLDREATRRGITRQALIKVWLFERLDASK